MSIHPINTLEQFLIYLMFTCHIKSVSSPTTPVSQNTLLSRSLYSQGLPRGPLHSLPAAFPSIQVLTSAQTHLLLRQVGTWEPLL